MRHCAGQWTTLVGYNAGLNATNAGVTCFGYQAGSTNASPGNNCIAIGMNAGGTGSATAMAANSIVITASGQVLAPNSGCYINPIRGSNGSAGNVALVSYDTSTSELIRSTPPGITIVNNSTSGTTQFCQVIQQLYWKKVCIYLNNAIGTATYSFVTGFTFVPGIIASSAIAASSVTTLTAGSVTITGNNGLGGAQTGWIFLEGF